MHKVQKVDTGSDAAALDRPGTLLGVNVAAGSAAASVTIFDNATAASGDIVAIVKATSNNSRAWEIPQGGIALKNGAFVQVSGTGASAFVVVA
jgi:hypothetical protein